MKKTICDSILDSDSRFEGQMINGIVNCLALQHGRFNEAVMTVGATSPSLSYDPLNSELYERAWHIWSSLKSDLWFHLELENALVFLWSGHQLSSGLDFVGELSREQREIRELVRQNGFRARHREHRALAHLRLPGSLTTDRVGVIEAGRLPGLSFSLMSKSFGSASLRRNAELRAEGAGVRHGASNYYSSAHADEVPMKIRLLLLPL